MRPLNKPAAWLLCLAGGVLSLGCLTALVRFGFRWVLAWWLVLSLSAAYAGWSLTRDQDAPCGGQRS
jgi:membrane protein implicated in regulation of membrane protease activity